MDNKELKRISDFCNENWQERCKKVIQVADDVCNNKFLFDMPWDLERTEEPVHFDGKINWLYMLNGDKEFIYQINRHGFLLHLGQAYWLTGDDKYAKKYCELLNSWLDDVPRKDGKDTTWRTLEVGIRLDNWVKALPYIEGTPFYTDELKQKVEKSIDEHIDVLVNSHNPFHITSNWGIIQDEALFVGASLNNDTEKMQIAVDRLTKETELQVMDDGVHSEQSCGYHNAVLVCLLTVYYTAKKVDFDLPKTLVDNILKLASVNKKWLKPNGHHPLFGDSDDNDIRDILGRCAILFDDEEFKYLAYDVLDYDTSWYYGVEGIEKFNSLGKKEPEFLNSFMQDSGNYVLRSDWSNKANWLFMHNSFTGGGHAHADKLHFDLAIKGEDVLVDAGRYSYLNNAKRQFVKEPQGHNTFVLDNKKFLKMTSAWDVINPALSIEFPVFENEHCELIGGGHLGYLKSKNAYVQRQILHIKPDIYIVLDRVDMKLYHTFRQYFHFAPQSEIKINNNIVSFDNGNVKANMHFVSNGIHISPMKSVYSANYNALCENPAIETKLKSFGNCTAVTVIYGNSKDEFSNYEVSRQDVKLVGKNNALPSNKAEGVVIKTKDHEYTVVMIHYEVKAPFVCNGKEAAGRIMVFEDDKIVFRKW